MAYNNQTNGITFTVSKKKKIAVIGNARIGKSLAYELAKNKCGLPIVVGRSEQLKCLMEDDKPNCECELNHCFKKGW